MLAGERGRPPRSSSRPLASWDFRDVEEDALPESAGRRHHEVRALGRAADPETGVASRQDTFSDRVEEPIVGVDVAGAFGLFDERQSEPFTHHRQVATAVELERDRGHRLDVRGDPGRIASCPRPVRPGDQDHQLLAGHRRASKSIGSPSGSSASICRPPGPDTDRIPERDARGLHHSDPCRQVIDLDDEPVPTTGDRLPTIRHRPRGRAAAAQPDAQSSASDEGERGPHLLDELEAQVVAIEDDRPVNVGHQVAHGRPHQRDPRNRPNPTAPPPPL